MRLTARSEMINHRGYRMFAGRLTYVDQICHHNHEVSEVFVFKTAAKTFSFCGFFYCGYSEISVFNSGGKRWLREQ